MLSSAAGTPAVWGGPEHVPGVHTRSGNAMGRTRAGLLDGAARAFADHGLRRSTMQSIAAAAGVAKATLYNHFRTKDEVAAALLAVELDRLSALAETLPRDQALAALSDELGAHPVLRRLAATEPEALTALLAVGAEQWAELTARLGAALRVDDDGAELAARWLLGVVLQPGRSTTRRRHAGRLAAVLA
jgi:AcrR family transcriptional regulator